MSFVYTGRETMDSGGMSAYDAQRIDMRNAQDRADECWKLYEELRAAIDDGHESMTHDDAVAWVKDIRAEMAELYKTVEVYRKQLYENKGEAVACGTCRKPMPQWGVANDPQAVCCCARLYTTPPSAAAGAVDALVHAILEPDEDDAPRFTTQSEDRADG